MFSGAALAQAQQIAQASCTWERPQVQGVTIDGPTSLDLDDAIWVEERGSEAVLSVHVADVAAWVPMGSVLDHDAIARVCTRYHRSGNSPMFPPALSEGCFSLQEGQLRPTLTIELVLQSDGQISDCNIFESQLISRKRFSYDQADGAIASPADPWHPQLQSCQQWAQRLNQHRREAGAMGGMETLSGAFLDENGRLVSDPDARYQSHQVIAEFMIAANTAVAQWLAQADCPALYRNHTAKEIAPGQDVMLQALLVLGSAQAIRNRLQNWLNRAEYGAALIGHFALNVWAYGHFTSPIRRLADLVNHRIIKAQLRGEEMPYSKLDLENLSGHINQTTMAETQAVQTYYRNKAKAELRHQLASEEGFATLSEKALSRLLKHAEGSLPAALAEEVRSRLSQGQLQVLDYYLLLFKGQDADLKQSVLAYLEGEIQDAASLLSLAVTQEAAWSELNYTELRQGKQFLAWTEIEIEGKLQTTVQPGQASRKQMARHLACWQWIDRFIQGQLVGERGAWATNEEPISQEVEDTHQPSAPFEASQNYIGTLLELCQAKGWEHPIFEFEAQDSGFSCLCRLGYEGREVEGVAIAPQKKKAKQQAAREVLSAMNVSDSKGK